MSEKITIRTFGSLRVKVITRKTVICDVVCDLKYQHRIHDNPHERARKLAVDVRRRGSERWKDNMLVVELNGKTVVLDGFARHIANPLIVADGRDDLKFQDMYYLWPSD